MGQINHLVRYAVAITLLLGTAGCGGSRSLQGSWETTATVIRIGKETILKDIKKGSFAYSRYIFRPDDTLIITGLNENQSMAMHYDFKNDTIRIIAQNGMVSVVPVLRLNHKELHLRHLSAGDSVVGIFRRID